MAVAPTTAQGPMDFGAFRAVFAARAASSAGSYIQIVAATWYVYSLTGSATAVGVLSALALGPAIVGGPIGGALADRYDPRRLSILLSVAQAVPAGLMAVLAGTGVLTVPWLYVLVFLGAIPFSLNQPVITLIAPYTVPEEFRHAAVARTSMIYNITRLLGSVVGGFLVDAVGVGVAFAINSASYVFVAIVLWRITLVEQPVVRRSGRQSIGAGLRTGWGMQVLRATGIGLAVFFTLVAPVEQLMPSVAQEHGFDASDVGILIGAIAVGALLANPFVGRRNNSAAGRRRLMAYGLLLAAPGLILLGVTPRHGLAIDLVAAVLIGFGWEFVFVSGQATVAVETAAHIRGAMMGVFFVLVTATTALGAVAVGFLIESLGLMHAFVVVAAVVVVAGIALYVISLRTPPESAAHHTDSVGNAPGGTA